MRVLTQIYNWWFNSEDQRDIDELVRMIEGDKGIAPAKQPTKYPPQPKQRTVLIKGPVLAPHHDVGNHTKPKDTAPVLSSSAPMTNDHEICDGAEFTVVKGKKRERKKIHLDSESAKIIKKTPATANEHIETLRTLATNNVNWEAIPSNERSTMMASIDGQAKYLQHQQVFFLIWSCARLDINFFAIFSNYDRLLWAVEKANCFPPRLQPKVQCDVSVLWGLTVMMYKYANTAQQTKLINLIQARLNVMQSISPEDVHRLHFVRQLLLQKSIAWPSSLLNAVSVQNSNKHSRAEKEIYNTLTRLYPDIEFKFCSKENNIVNDHHVLLHEIDIVVPTHKLAIEIEGGIHYYEGSDKINTCTWMRNKLIRQEGYELICIDVSAWRQCIKAAKKQFFLQEYFDSFIRSTETLPPFFR